MEEAPFVPRCPTTKNGFFARKRLRRMTRGWNGVLRYIMVGVAVALLISPDPFTDILAFWLMGKASISLNLKSLTGRMKNVLHD